MQAWGARITSPKGGSVQWEGRGMAGSISRLSCGELGVQGRAGMLCQPLSSLPLGMESFLLRPDTQTASLTPSRAFN